MYSNFIKTTFLLSSIIPQYDIYPSGENIVFEIKTEGIIVTGGYDIKQGKDVYNPLKDSDIQIGDMIIEIDNMKVNSIKEFMKIFSTYSTNDTITLNIMRNKSKITRKLKVFKINGQVKTGLYVKDRILGVGTLTFIDTDNNIYGALGHEVMDNSQIVNVSTGEIYKESVTHITKGYNGNPGEKSTTTKLNVSLGDIKENTEFGLFGTINEKYTPNYALELGNKDEIKLGKAKILTCISGNKIEEFDIEITNLKNQKEKDLKGITFKITDKRLLNEVGGIYSGMSGSPIIQDDKIVGAVTHVVVNDIKYGYGVYIEYMYAEALEKMKIK